MATQQPISIVIDPAILQSFGGITIRIGTSDHVGAGGIAVSIDTDVATASTSKSSVLQTPPVATACRLLSLPSELRNRIWEYTFTPDANAQDGRIDLLSVKEANPALLLTCRQIYTEACQIYTGAHETFWTTSSFYINGCSLSSVRKTIQCLNEANVAKIRHLAITGVSEHRFELHDGVWKCFDACANAGLTARVPCPKRAIMSPPHNSQDLVKLIRLRVGFHPSQMIETRTIQAPGSRDYFSWVDLPNCFKPGGVAFAKEASRRENLTKQELLGIVARYQERAWDAMGKM